MYIDNNTYNNYQNFAHITFNWLNGKVNKINIASELQITTNRSDSFGHRVGGKVLLDLYTIIQQFSQYDSLIRGFIVDVITHELFHMDQEIDAIRYSQDLKYKEEIENQVRHLTAQYILNNYDVLVRALRSDFSTTPMEFTLENLKGVTISDFQYISLKQVYEYHLTILSLGKYIDIDKYDSIYFKYKYSNGSISDFVIKTSQALSRNTYKFNQIMSDIYSSIGMCTMEECNSSTFGRTLFITIEQSSYRNMIVKIRNKEVPRYESNSLEN
jgi:hypothetical protein